jgi:predicted esterase
MKTLRNSIVKTVLTTALCLPLGLVLAQPPPTQQPAPPNARGAAPVQRGGRGMMGGDPRVQHRTYVFTNTGETLPYSVFVSSKVTNTVKAPLILALHGLGGNNDTLMGRATINLAEEGGYILVGPMGYNSSGSFGMPFGGMGAAGRRGGPTANAPAAAPQAQGTNQAPTAPPTRGGRGIGMGMPVRGGTAETNSAKVTAYSELDAMNVLAMVRKEFNVDDNRIYLMGHSLGGGGALHMGDKFASIWAGVAVMAPAAFGFRPVAQSELKGVPLLVLQGDADTTVQPAGTARLADQLKALNYTSEYKVLPGVDHGSIIASGMPDVFQFFAKHTKPQPKN